MEVGWGGSSWLLCVHFLDVLRVFRVAGKIITQKDNILAGIKKYSGGKIGKISLN